MIRKCKRLKLDIQLFADGEIKYKVNLDDKEAGSKLSKLGNIGKTAFKTTAIAIGSASVALGGLVLKSAQMAGDLEQQIGGSEAVFEKFAETVQKKGVEAYKVMGLSQNDYLATANKMGSLMQGAGLSVEKSMDLSTQAMQRAADVASVMGIDTSMAMESIAGAAKGNFTMMDNLGVAMNDTTLQAYALEKGITKSTQSMTNAEKVELAMQMFLEKTSKYAGNYAKENETFAGSFSTLKASIQNFLSGASDIDPVIDSVMQFSRILIKTIGKMAPKIVTGIVQLINEIIPQLPSLLQQLLPTIINGALTLIQGLVQAMPQIIQALQSILPLIMNGIMQLIMAIVNMAPQILQALVNMLPVIATGLANALPTLIPTIVQAIIGLMQVFNDNMPLFLKAGMQIIVGLVKGLINSIPLILKNLGTIIKFIINFFTVSKLLGAGKTLITGLFNGLMSGGKSLLSNIPKLIGQMINYFKTKGISGFKSAGGNLIKNLYNGIKSIIPDLLSKISTLPSRILTKIKNGLNGITSIGKNLIKGLWNGIASVKDWILSKISGFGKSILNGIKSFFGIHSPSKKFAWIGKMNMVGLEEGMEENVPDIEKTISLAYDTSGLDYLKNGFANVSSNFTNNIPNDNQTKYAIYLDADIDLDTDSFGKVFVKNIKTFSGGAKNSYNYGGGK